MNEVLRQIDVFSDVSQGSKLTSLFYIVFFNEIKADIKHSNFLKRIDDTTIFIKVTSVEDVKLQFMFFIK